MQHLYNKTEIQNSKILILGDDGSQTISLALTKLPKEIVCLEIDERIVNFINKIAKNEKLNIKAIKYDVQEPLNLKDKFDVFITDPLETIPAAKLFLSRGISKLHSDSVLYFTLSRVE